MTDTFAHTTLHNALLVIQEVVASAVQRTADGLGDKQPPVGISRQGLANLQTDVQRRSAAFIAEIDHVLRDGLNAALAPKVDAARPLTTTTRWETLSLVDDTEVDARVDVDRLGLAISHGCEWELRELDGFVSSLLRQQRGDANDNPLRPDAIGNAILKAVDVVGIDKPLKSFVASEVARTLAPSMRASYEKINQMLRDLGVQPAMLSLRTAQSSADAAGGGSGTGWRPSAFSATGSGTRDSAWRGAPSTGFGSSPGGGSHVAGGSAGAEQRPLSARAADAQMLDMLRRLSQASGALTSQIEPGGGQGMPSEAPWPAAAGGFGNSASQAGAVSDGAGGAGGAGGAPIPGMMAVNLIRQHRDELVRASGGALDHMVIDVVSAMFDHLLSDSKVPPQLARQIARLQMPVLRAALKDAGFFSSRRHPVRRFVNRIASLAAAYEDLDEGPGRDFIERVRALVQEIVDGDFDQMELYESKLQSIETLIHEQSRRDVGSHASAASLLDGKETQLRIQQRFMRELKTQLEPLALPPYLLDFLSQVWSQVQVQVAGPQGSPELAGRMRRAARELVLSVQPKGEPQLRKEFLLKLPQLMKDLNEGLSLIRWPEPARADFLGKLLPAHANSLKVAPLTDFEQRQLRFKLDQVDKVAIPIESDIAAGMPAVLPPADQHVVPLQFSEEEASRIGLVDESAVDWNGQVDIEIDPVAAQDATPDGSAAAADVDIGLQIEPRQGDGGPPTHGPQLVHHLQTGVAYRMHLRGQWQRVRLSWVSPGRAFFVFTHGKAHQETISMTSRMLTRMCEAERFRTYEQAELIERATARARKQLAQLNAATRLAAHSR